MKNGLPTTMKWGNNPGVKLPNHEAKYLCREDYAMCLDFKGIIYHKLLLYKQMINLDVYCSQLEPKHSTIKAKQGLTCL